MSTWGQVVDMFKELRLSVCDDEKAVREAFERKRGGYLSDSAKPDPVVAERARTHMKNAQSLIDGKSRASLLGVVFDVMAIDCRALLDVIPQGTTVSASLRATLLDKAVNTYRCRQDLAALWVDRLLIGVPLEPPLVPNFRAINGFRQIRLEWDKPPTACDHVNVYRGTTLLASLSSGCTVDAAAPAGPVDYTARAVCSGREGKPSSTRGFSLDEVKNPAARIENQQIVISWDPPFADARVCVFRRENTRPEVRKGASGPEPAGADSTLVTQGRSPWKEVPDKDGVTLHYLIVVHDGLGLYTPGVHLQVRIPTPPASPGPAKAEYTGAGGKDNVRVSWAASPSSGCQYVVVRNQGPVAPASLRDGKTGTATSGTAWADDLPDPLQPGKRYTYAVFAVAGGIPSRHPSVAPPVAILSEVANLNVETTATGARLRWQPPSGVGEVLVRRGTQPPANPSQGTPLTVRNNRTAEDAGLVEGHTYYYGVFCTYSLDDHTLVCSRGVGEKVVPSSPPQPVQNFEVRIVGSEIRCDWTEPGRGSVEVRRSRVPLDDTGNRTLNSAELKALLAHCDPEPLKGKDGTAIDRAPKEAAPYYTPIVSSGSLAVVGRSVECFACASVLELEAFSADDTEFALKWRFPNGCMVAQVLVRPDRWPCGPDDQEAWVETVTELEYGQAGGFHRVKVRPGTSQVFVAVLAMHRTPQGKRVFASASDPASRCGPVECLRPMRLCYDIRRKFLGGGKLSLALRVEFPRTEFAGVLLLASPSLPVTRESGEVVLRWNPSVGDGKPLEQRTDVSLANLRGRGWRRWYLRLVAAERSQEAWTKIQHPAACVIECRS